MPATCTPRSLKNAFIFCSSSGNLYLLLDQASSNSLPEIDAVVDSLQDLFLIIGIGQGDPYRLVGADTRAHLPHPRQVAECTALPFSTRDRLEITVSGTGAAADAVLGDLDREALEARHDLIEVLRGDVLQRRHHAAAVAAEADRQEFTLVAREEDEVVDPHLARHRDQPGLDGALHVRVGLLARDLSAHAVRHLERGLAHEEAADVVGVILAVPCPTAETTIYDDMVGRLFDIRGDHLGGHGDAFGAQGFIDREVGDAALASDPARDECPAAGGYTRGKMATRWHDDRGSNRALCCITHATNDCFRLIGLLSEIEIVSLDALTIISLAMFPDRRLETRKPFPAWSCIFHRLHSQFFQ